MFIPFSEYGVFEEGLFHFNILPLFNAAIYIENKLNEENELKGTYRELVKYLDSTLNQLNQYYTIIEQGGM